MLGVFSGYLPSTGLVYKDAAHLESGGGTLKAT